VFFAGIFTIGNDTIFAIEQSWYRYLLSLSALQKHGS